jgi:hypothetical protein
MKHIDQLSDDELGLAVRQAVQALPDAPLALQRRAIGLWPAQAASSLAGLARAALNQIAAVLSFDSWATPGLAQGMRAMRSPTRQLLYSAQGRDIDLRIAPSGDGFALAGQVLGPDDSGAIALHRQGVGHAAPHEAQLDGLGEFRFDGVAPGDYQLTLRLGADEIVLPTVEVGEPTH